VNIPLVPKRDELETGITEELLGSTEDEELLGTVTLEDELSTAMLEELFVGYTTIVGGMQEIVNTIASPKPAISAILVKRFFIVLILHATD
jgi:hypothetical protein